ncbi:hypothetical protein J437_LFUL014179 [Ladona fulva]|uniref:Uncharacterized protein n=1 Tax=Ladona fulva TaxID=123851 RepID=A0A8K0P3Z3_LADFU|nr:hypothetical protein J437_LFUL014179 [Ladona fulva]
MPETGLPYVTFDRKRSSERRVRGGDPLTSSIDVNMNGFKVEAIKDLGIILDSTLNFKAHTTTIYNKLLGFIKINAVRNFSLQTALTSFCNIDRPVIEYASISWNPYHLKKMYAIERIQQHWDCSHDKYPQIRHRLNLPLLESRRKVADVLFLKKLFSNRIDCPQIISKIGIAVPTRIRRSMPKLDEPSCRVNANRYSPLSQIARETNKFISLTNTDFFRDSISAIRRKLQQSPSIL